MRVSMMHEKVMKKILASIEITAMSFCASRNHWEWGVPSAWAIDAVYVPMLAKSPERT